MRGLSALALVVLLAGCRPNEEPGVAIDDRPDITVVGPPGGDLATKHNERVADLRLVHARGNVEIRWDEAGTRRQVQGDADFWYLGPVSTAVRVSKIGEELAWLGSNDRQCWLFDMLAEPSVVYVGDVGTPLDAFGPQGLSIQPWALLDLMGLSTLTADDPDAAATGSDEEGWTITGRGAGGRVRVTFEAGTWRPVRIEALGDDGGVLLTSRLKDYERVPLPGRAIVACPAAAEQIRVNDPSGAAEVELYLRQWSGDLAEEDVTRYYDLDKLRGFLRPQRIVER